MKVTNTKWNQSDHDLSGNIAIYRPASNCDFWSDACRYVSIAAEIAHRRSICASNGTSAHYSRLRLRFEAVGDDLSELRGGPEGIPLDQRTRFLKALNAAADQIEARNRWMERRLDKVIEHLRAGHQQLN